jgi:mycothiol synthase
MDGAGFHGWDEGTLRPWLQKILPDGWFTIIHEASGEIVATAMANHNPSDLHPFGGELGWVAGHPDYPGVGLGMSVCGAVVKRLLGAGYQEIYLNTDDWRLPAIRTYLKLGFEPFLFLPDMAERWRVVCNQVDWPSTPDLWPKARTDTDQSE